MADKFGREYTLDLSPLLDTDNVVRLENSEQAQAIIDAAIEQYPERVWAFWYERGVDAMPDRGRRCALSFRGVNGCLGWGYIGSYKHRTDISILPFDSLVQFGSEIPESDFGLEYILGVEL